jgi:hypothetical protein
VSPHSPIGLPLRSLPLVSLGFQRFPFLIISGTQMVGGDLPICHGLGSILVVLGHAGRPPRKARRRVTHSLHGPFWPANHLNSVTTDSHALCILLDICAVQGHSTVHNILLYHSRTGSLIMGASTSSLPSDSPLRCLLNNLDTLGLTPDIKPIKFNQLLHSNLALLSFRQPKSLDPFRVFRSHPFTGHITTVSNRDDGERFHYVQAFSYLRLNLAL